LLGLGSENTIPYDCLQWHFVEFSGLSLAKGCVGDEVVRETQKSNEGAKHQIHTATLHLSIPPCTTNTLHSKLCQQNFNSWGKYDDSIVKFSDTVWTPCSFNQNSKLWSILIFSSASCWWQFQKRGTKFKRVLICSSWMTSPRRDPLPHCACFRRCIPVDRSGYGPFDKVYLEKLAGEQSQSTEHKQIRSQWMEGLGLFCREQSENQTYLWKWNSTFLLAPSMTKGFPPSNPVRNSARETCNSC
jgi:hypothetical protein